MDSVPETRRNSKATGKSQYGRYLAIIGLATLGCGARHGATATETMGDGRNAHADQNQRAATDVVKPAPTGDARVSASTTMGTDELRYLGQAAAQLVPGNFWAPILEASSGATGELVILVASAPAEAPGPRLTVLRFENSGPQGTLSAADTARHPLILSQSVLDDKDTLQGIRQFLSAPKTRTSFALPKICAEQSPAQAHRSLQDHVVSLRDTRTAPQNRVDALAAILSTTTPDLALSPPHLRQLLDVLSTPAAPTITQASERRATITTERGRLELIRRKCWIVSNFTPTPAAR